MASPFENLGLLPQFVQVVEQMGFEQPTPIQQQAIPALLSGRNVIGQAQTGTGKTAAYALPLLQSILQTEPVTGKRPVRALVLAPTRELAIQVSEAAGKMAQGTSLRVLTVYGGQSYQIQTRQLERGVDVVVGTPGRLLDLMRQDRLDLSQVRFLVLDEADEMLEMGFIEDVETILAELPAERQMALFSATLPEAVRKLANNYLSDPLKISINPTRPTVAETEQRYCRVREEHKLPALTRLLEVEEVKSGLIFARTRVKVQELADELTRRGYPANPAVNSCSTASANIR
jgi:ATP-dependent RNA helicase DeaD